MTRSWPEDAFAHHVWTTTRLLDACGELTPEQLGPPCPETHGSILETSDTPSFPTRGMSRPKFLPQDAQAHPGACRR